ncbi:cytochrome c oxidase-assembly factor cox23 [Phaffia rhodozyma]|uniref:Cytochrome c oxidase-assembly factor cox23 n=1 Tax=Phaffia rhodozyma TaxID=264483 RepID=A0A0F7SKD2_PHARH|nr:cytochrome c oxidase-assembly factor cox23 [Phaffia rhodozyma]
MSSSSSTNKPNPVPPFPAGTHSKPTDEEPMKNYREREANMTPGSRKSGLTWKEMQKRNVVSKFQDPCAEAAQQSMLCMEQNQFDKEKCTDYFQAYRDCKDGVDEKSREASKKDMSQRTGFLDAFFSVFSSASSSSSPSPSAATQGGKPNSS